MYIGTCLNGFLFFPFFSRFEQRQSLCTFSVYIQYTSPHAHTEHAHTSTCIKIASPHSERVSDSRRLTHSNRIRLQTTHVKSHKMRSEFKCDWIVRAQHQHQQQPRVARAMHRNSYFSLVGFSIDMKCLMGKNWGLKSLTNLWFRYY